MPNLSLWERLTSQFKTTIRQDEFCFWTVDIHSHLIPGIDDGVQDTKQALICLRQLADWGIRKLITTPHVNREWYPNTIDTIRQGKIRLQTLADEHQLPLHIEVAAEYLIDESFFDLLREDALLAFGDEKYLLIETGRAWPPNNINDILLKIQQKGYTPVLAHPERYSYYIKDRKALLSLHQMGCLFQLNWMSLAGRYGTAVQQQARYLLNEKRISFIGSDVHHPRDLADMARLFNPADLRLIHQQPLLNQSLLDNTAPAQNPLISSAQ